MKTTLNSLMRAVIAQSQQANITSFMDTTSTPPSFGVGSKPNRPTMKTESTNAKNATNTTITTNTAIETSTISNNITTKSSDSSNNHLKPRQEERLKQAFRRDVAFLLAGAIAAYIVSYIETHASDATIRKSIILKSFSNNGNYDSVNNNGHYYCGVGRRVASSGMESNGCMQESLDFPAIMETNAAQSEHTEHTVYNNDSSPCSTGILDAGFVLTTPLHAYLSNHRDMNDLFAMMNSLLLTIPLLYVIHVTLWRGDFTLSFRLIATHLFRSLCGWFTYLPPDPEFLMSYYDFPEIFLCLFRECHHTPTTYSTNTPNNVPFVTFFSGHIATIVIIANHLYVRKHVTLSITLHCFNWLQAIRLLATRGHYSIDLIIGYVVAVFVSSPAARLGLYYSVGIMPTLPQNWIETFEVLVGVERVASELGLRRSCSNSCIDCTDGVERDQCDEVNDNDPKKKEKRMAEKQSFLSSRLSSSNHDDLNNVQSDTSVRVAVEIVTDYAHKKTNSVE